jgi:hypothetical protein
MDTRSLITSAVTTFFIALFLSLRPIPRKARPTGTPGGFELQYSAIVRGLGIVTCAMSVCFVILGLVTLWEPSIMSIGTWQIRAEHGGPYLAVAAVPIAVGGFVLIVESFTVFRMAPDGMVRQRIFGKPASLRWSDVTRVVARNHEMAIHVVTAHGKMYFSAWLSGRDILAGRILDSVPPSAITDRAEIELRKLADSATRS